MVLVGQLQARKRIDHAIRAVALVVQEVPQGRLEIYGEGASEAALRALIEDLGLQKSVALMGYSLTVDEAQARAACTLMTSTFEGFGRVISESMSLGTPVVSYHIRYGPRDLIRHGVDGVLVELHQGARSRSPAACVVGSVPRSAAASGRSGGVPSLLQSSHAWREVWAEELLDRLTPVMSALGVLFLLVVIGEQFARAGSAVSVVLTVLGWVLWVVFALEFVARMVVAPSTSRFLKKNWWQLLFLVLPFLRILRLVRALRLLRTGRVLSSAIRTSRSARGLLGGRIGWLSMVSAITVLASSLLLFQFAGYDTYGQALHDAALATITGEPLARPDAFSQILEVVLAVFSVVVFATLAGSLGAYFLHRGPAGADASE